MSFLWLLNDIRTPILNKIMQFITYFGQDIIIIVIICTLYWCVNKEFAYLVGINYFVAGLMVQTLKVTFRIPRPWVLDPKFKAVDSAIAGATGYSFPSGHTQGATSLYASIALKANKKGFKILFTLMFLLVGFSRMYLGAHTPKDVLTAMVISLIIAFVVWKCRKSILERPENNKKVFIILLVSSFVVMVYTIILRQSGIVDLADSLDAIKAAGAGLGFSIGFYLERTRLNFSVKCSKKWHQPAKLLVGLAVALLLKSGIGFIAGDSIIAAMLEYFILVLWVIYVYPAVFKNFTKSK